MKTFHTIPEPTPTDIIEWAETTNLKVDGHSFDKHRVPQLIEPIRAMNNPRIRTGTLVKPVQSGGSTAGEVVVAFWSAFYYGLIQYNWEDDGKAKWRWDSRILKMLQSCADLRWAGGKYDATSCCARFVNALLLVQGTAAEGALDSETVPFQVNEEIQLWKPGDLDKARRRQTLVWNNKAFDISNAGLIGDQLESAYEEGSMDQWEVLCPGCKSYHIMRFRWDEKHPQLGGLRFDVDAGRKDKRDKHNFGRLVETIRYQMPCGFIVNDSPKERRALVGRYRQTNQGAPSYKKSWNYEAVSVTEIKWPDLVSEWLKAVKSVKAGDDVPMQKFVQERECRFWSKEMIPFSGQVVVNNTLRKSRDGLKDRIARFWFADKQRGFIHKGEFTHYWLVIRDVTINSDSQLVYEGLCQTDNDLINTLKEHNCSPEAGAVDCTWDRDNVLQFCYRFGCNAQTSSGQDRLFFHPDSRSYRTFSQPEGLHRQLSMPPKFNYSSYVEDGVLKYRPDPQEPMHWLIHKVGSLKLLNFLRSHKNVVEYNKGTDYIRWDIPGDVSDDYLKQIDSWEFSIKRKTGTDQVVEICKQRLREDHLLMCEAGIANLMMMAPHPQFKKFSILAARLSQLGLTESAVGTRQERKDEKTH